MQDAVLLAKEIKKSTLKIIVVIVLATVVGIGTFLTVWGLEYWRSYDYLEEYSEEDEVEVIDATAADETSDTISLTAEEGETALQLLQAEYRVILSDDETSILSIDDLEADSTHTWALLINDVQVTENPLEYTVKADDAIVWKLIAL